jgi:peptide/nickel transport system substrate-binding protein
MRKSVGSLLVVILFVMLFLAPVPAMAEKVLYAAGDPNELGVTTFNPIKVELNHEAMSLIYDKLIEWGLDGQYYSGLAESWTISDDGLTWKMKLKEGVTFHDGSPFNAEVAKWFLKEMETGPSGYMVGAIDNVEINGPYAITMHLKHPEPNMLFNLSQTFMAVPSMVAYKKYGEEFGTKYVVGSGPYMFESWSPGDRLVLVKNPNYTWGPGMVKNKGPAKIDKVVYRDIKEESTRFLELKTGKLDVVFALPTMFIDKVEQDKSLRVVRLPGNQLYHIVMNTQSAPLDNQMVRKGIALAVDQVSITKNVFADAGKPAFTYLIDSLPESKIAEKDQIRFDPEGAKAALEEAGWTVGTDGIRVDKEGNRLELKMLAKNESSYRRVAEVVQAQLAAVGVDAKITLLDPSTIRAHLKNGEHQLAVRSYEWENADILEWFLNSTRMGYPNAAMWHDNESDYLMQRAMTRSRSLQERIDNFKEYHTYLLNQYVWAPIYLPDTIFGVGKRLVLSDPNLDRQFLGMGVLDYDLK